MDETNYPWIFILMTDSAVHYDDGNIFRSGLVKTGFVAFLILYFLYLVLSQAPASIAAWAVHQAMPTIWLTSVEGTLWSGVARGSQVDLGTQTVPLGQVRWQLNPMSILFFSPCVKFQSDMASGKFCHSIASGNSVEDLSVEAPLAIIKDLLPFPASGQFSLQVISADFSPKNIKQLDAKMSLQGARINPVDQWVNIGSIAAQAQADGEGGVSAKIFELDGPLGIDMQANWKPGAKNWQMVGNVTLKEGAPSIFREGLQALGEEVSKDTYKVQWP